MLDWKQIIEENGPAVWKRVFRIVGNDADALDCFQDVFLTAVKASRREPIRNMAGFLSLSAARCAIDCLRRGRRLPLYSADAFDIQLACNEPDPAKSLQDGELAEMLRAGLSRLPELEAQAFALQAFEELSYRQIADHMHVRENYVGVLINRARASLRQILKSVAAEYDREVPHAK